MIAPEGININISVKESEYEIIEKNLKKLLIIKMKILKKLKKRKHIFRKFKIKIKKEILTTRNIKDTILLICVGKYVEADEWNNLY